jgi:hypothetical protein
MIFVTLISLNILAALLDILFEQNPYPAIQEVPIASPFL